MINSPSIKGYAWPRCCKWNLSCLMTKPTKWVRAQRRLRSDWASPSLIRVFTVRMKKAWTLSYHWAHSEDSDAQSDQSLRWVHSHIVGFVTRRLIYKAVFFLIQSIKIFEMTYTSLMQANYTKHGCFTFPFYNTSSFFQVFRKNIWIFNGREVWIKNSVTKTTVRHHSASLVMPNSYPEWRNFHFEPNNHYRFFFFHTLLSTIAFRLECMLFYQIYTKITTFSIKRCSVRFGSYLRRWHVWRKIDINLTSRRQNDVKASELSFRHHARESSYTPCLRRHFLAPVRIMEIPVGYARKFLLKEFYHFLVLRCPENPQPDQVPPGPAQSPDGYWRTHHSAAELLHQVERCLQTGWVYYGIRLTIWAIS